MEKSEPTLVPEWLRNTGNITGGGNSATHFASSSSHSDFSSLANHTRNRNSKSTSDFVDNPRSALLDRTSSSNSRRSSTNGSAKHAYSSFSRGNRDRDREKERSSFSNNHWESDSIDPIGKSTLQRSQSMLSRKQGDTFPRKVGVDLRNGSNTKNGNGVHSGSIQKAVFEKDFPSLGTEEIGRVPSPVQSLPALIGSGEGWTSALAEVPNMIASSNTVSSSVQQTSAVISSVQPASASLNMAEALTQPPSKARATPQLSVKTQRLEELAIKQSRQLIPVTPSITKGSTLSLSDKTKPKAAVRSNEMNLTPKAAQQQPSSPFHANNQSVGGIVKTDPPKTKLLVLKPGRQNGLSSNHNKDVVSSPTNNNANNQPAVSPAPSRSPKISSGDRKNPISGFTVEKKPTVLQTQKSRNDFFNLLKKKTSNNASGSVPSSKSDTVTNEGQNSHTIVNGVSNGEVGDNKSSTSDAPAYPDEEEVAFLRSLGWDENSGEDEGLTEEEINAFRQQYMMKPLLKKSIETKLPESHATIDLTSSDSESEV